MAADGAENHPKEDRPAPARTVLVVEDNPIDAALLEGVLDPAEFKVVMDDGSQAWNLINSMAPPDLVLLDILIGETNGIRLLDHIRARRPWRSVPVVMLSGLADRSHVTAAMAAGANGFIAKPFDPVRLRRELERFLPLAGK